MKQIKIKGVIIRNDDAWIYDLFGIEATCPNDVATILESAAGEDVEISINSGGGLVSAGQEIYTMLREYRGHVLIKIQSMAASSAAVIAMAGESEISPVAQLMIHNVTGENSGDNRSMEHMAEVLETTNKALASAFRLKTGKSEEEILDLMNNETWLTAERAVKEGFVDRVMFEPVKGTEPVRLAASTGSGLLPSKVLDYARTHLTGTKNNAAMEKAKAEFEFLKMEEKKHDI